MPFSSVTHEASQIELVNMVIECCSQERSYSTFYGLTSERFCKLNRVWCECFERAFETYYDTIHRYETNRLRNIARLFGHLFANDAISWAILQTIKMNEDDTTSSSRIFVKIMMQEVTESMGLPTLKERFADPEIKALCTGMFPLDNPKNTRFAINYLTSIGLGALTEEMREHLKVSPDQDSIPHAEANKYLYRMHPVLSWSNAVQCWRPNHPPPTVPRMPTRLLTPLPIPTPTPTPTRRKAIVTATAAVVLRLRRVALSGILPVVDVTTAGHPLHRPVLVGTSRVADAMTVAHHHHHLAPGGMTIEGTTAVAVMAETVANPLHGIVGAVSRIRGRPLVGATTARVSVRRRDGRLCETAIETAIMTAKETTHGTDTGIAGVDGKALIYGLCAQHMSLSFYRSICVYVCVRKKFCAPRSSAFCSLMLQM